MRIALLTDGITPFVIGGMQRHSFNLARYFAKNGIKVELYHPKLSSSQNQEMESLSCFSEDEKRNIRLHLVDFPSYSKLPGHYIRESYVYSANLFNQMKRFSEGIDFIYAKGFTAWKYIEATRQDKNRIPVGVNFHGLEMFQPAPSWKSVLSQSLFFKGPVRYNIRNADLVFSYGGRITDILKKEGVHPKNILEAPTGIDKKWLSDSPTHTSSPRKVLFVGRYERRKGIYELNQAIKGVLQNSNLQFHFIGDIPSGVKISSDRVAYHGKLTDQMKINSIMRSCDVLICPSHSEGMPNVILEAMGNGLAIIATDVGAIPVMVDKNNGWLLKDPTSDSITKALVHLTNTPEVQLNNMKYESLRKVNENFLWDQVISIIINGIQGFIASRG